MRSKSLSGGLVALCAVLFLPPARAAEPPRIDGLWEGLIIYRPAEVEIETIVEIAPDASGKLVGSIDLPNLALKYHLLQNIAVNGSQVSFEFLMDSETRGPGALYRFEGAISSDGRVISGMFLEKDDRTPFRFERIGDAGSERRAAVERPVETLSDRGEELKTAFNRDVGRVRLVLLLSPT